MAEGLPPLKLVIVTSASEEQALAANLGMCGIALALFQESLPLDSASLVWERLTASARRRGPDAQDHLTLDCTPATNSEGPSCTLKAFGATLWMRGELTKQPLRSAGSFSKSGGAPDDFLLFNGEIFGGMDVPAGMNDGHVLLEKLKACSGAAADILRVLACVQGPFALIYFRVRGHLRRLNASRFYF